MDSVFKNLRPANCETCPYRSQRTFCNLAPAALEMYNAIGSYSRVARGTTLFHEGGPCDRVMVLCTGLVKLYCTSKAGRSLILKIAQPGEVLGLSAVISGTRHEATATTLQPTQIKSIPKAQFTALLEMHHEVSLHAGHALSLESNRAFLDIKRLTLSGSAAGRLAGVLLDWGRGQCRVESEIQFPMPLTHAELAALAGTSRETVTRTLRRFQDEKLIDIAGHSIQVLSPAGLEKIHD